MFESFEQRRAPRRPSIVPILVAAGGIGVGVLVVRSMSSRQDGRDEAGAPVPAPDVRPSLELTDGSYARLELPGMSLETPGRAPIRGDYVTGSVQMTTPEWAVTWQQGELPPRHALDSIVEAMARAIGAQQLSETRIAGSRELDVGGSPGRQYVLGDTRGDAAIATFASCGGRVVQILAGGRASAREIAARMVASFRCTPDPARALDREAIAVAVRPGWKRPSAGSLLLVDDREVVVRPSLFPDPQGLPLERFVPQAIRAAGFLLDSDRPEERAGRKVWRGSVGGDPAAIVAWQCPGDRRVAAVHVFSRQGAPLDRGIELALTGRCLAPGEDPPVYPIRGK